MQSCGDVLASPWSMIRYMTLLNMIVTNGFTSNIQAVPLIWKESTTAIDDRRVHPSTV